MFYYLIMFLFGSQNSLFFIVSILLASVGRKKNQSGFDLVEKSLRSLLIELKVYS